MIKNIIEKNEEGTNELVINYRNYIPGQENMDLITTKLKKVRKHKYNNKYNNNLSKKE